MVYGKAHTPYQYRSLIPSIVRIATAAVPTPVKAAMSRSVSPSLFYPMRWEGTFATGYSILLALLLLSLLGFIAATRYLFDGLFVGPPHVAALTAIAAALVLPTFFYPHSRYLYDFSTLFLFTFGLALMARRRWGWFAVLFPFACLNKETTILLTLVFAVHFGRARKPLQDGLYRTLLVYQLIVFVVIKVALLYAFRSNPGSIVEFHLFDYNLLNIVLEPYSLSAVLIAFGLFLATTYGWTRRPLFLRDSLVIVVPLLMLSLLFGYVDELRNYYEAYPIVLLLIASTVCDLRGISLVSRDSFALAHEPGQRIGRANAVCGP
jgi:hypothetical protein